MIYPPPDRRFASVPLVVAVTTIAGSLYVFFHDFPLVRELVLASGDPVTYKLLGFVFPALSDLGMISGALWITAAVGIHRVRPWAAAVVAAAAVTGAIATFMPIPPTIGKGQFFPSTVALALPAFVVGLLVVSRWGLRLSRKEVAFGCGGVIVALFCFIIGVASTHRILGGLGPVYVFAQRLEWLLLLGWLTFVIGLFSRRAWARPLGLGLAAATAAIGAPVGVADSIHLGRFSAFSVTPIFGALFGIALWLAGPEASLDDPVATEE
jgi:hypothetical protein